MPKLNLPSFQHLATHLLRTLPDFIIAGVQKGGTTSLFHYLLQHPYIHISRDAEATHFKEIHFFDLQFSNGIHWYRTCFPSRWEKLRLRWQHHHPMSYSILHPILTGEATPYYCFHPLALQRIAATVPKAKIILLLRNPVNRAYSHYQHCIRFNLETLSFSEAIAQEENRLQGEREKMLADPTYNSFSYQHHSYLARGRYIDQVKTLYEYFSKDRVLLLSSEAFYQNTADVVQKTLEFLELPPAAIATDRKYNINQYQEIDPDLKQQLKEYFQPYNQALYRYTGIDFGWDCE